MFIFNFLSVIYFQIFNILIGTFIYFFLLALLSYFVMLLRAYMIFLNVNISLTMPQVVSRKRPARHAVQIETVAL